VPQGSSNPGKIAILGYRSVGKSSLMIQFVQGLRSNYRKHFHKIDHSKWIRISSSTCRHSCQDEYSIFPQTYSIDINGYILMYSVTSIKSFEGIKVTHGKLLDMVGKVQVPIMLVRNKEDLHMERVISYEEGKALAESWNATAVDVFRRIILEAEKIDGAASQGKSSCSVMWVCRTEDTGTLLLRKQTVLVL
uniref:Uncharacterized protein n=1 Tax=Sus scrofa TaxID=9823 RepID=A0A4X1UM90_PIG